MLVKYLYKKIKYFTKKTSKPFQNLIVIELLNKHKNCIKEKQLFTFWKFLKQSKSCYNLSEYILLYIKYLKSYLELNYNFKKVKTTTNNNKQR